VNKTRYFSYTKRYLQAMTTTMNTAIIGLLVLTFTSCRQTDSKRQDGQSFIQQQTDTCDSPDAHISCSFASMPTTLTSTMTIVTMSEPDEKLIISGTIYKADGKTPYPNIILYAYHTDSKGYYSKNGNETGVQKWHGRLYGWCKTDKNGYYEIHTIRPARYPDNSMPAHIHAAIKKENGQMYWITDYVFKDDNLVTEKYLSSLSNVGGTGVVDIHKIAKNNWTGKRDITLTQ
jgi:protocatechuate 3,4-dioxygenase beta subunit